MNLCAIQTAQRDQTTKGYAPTNLFTAGRLSSQSCEQQLKTELSQDGCNSVGTWQKFEKVQGAFYQAEKKRIC